MMNKQEILKKIGNIIQELSEQHEYLSNTSELNELELELFAANADFLTDHIAILKKLNGTDVKKSFVEEVQEENISLNEEETEQSETEIPSLEEEHEQVSIEEPEKDIPPFKFNFEEPEDLVFDFEKNIRVEEVFDRKITEEEQEILNKIKQNEENRNIKDEKTEAEIVENETEKVEHSEEADQPVSETIEIVAEQEKEEPYLVTKEEENQNPVISETTVAKEEEPVIEVFSQSTPLEPIKQEAEEMRPTTAEPEKQMSLNEMLSAQRATQTVSYSRPVTDLKAAISLNDKMIFIRELFNGYNLAYSEAIEILNRFDSFEAADNFLIKNYAEKNNWVQKQEVVDRLYEILNRKFRS